MTSVPVDSVHHIEDVGHLLLEAQKDLARVRQRLEAMPLESNHSVDGPLSSDTLDSLRDLLNKTESNLRVKAEAVLKSVEENRINTLPVTTTQPMRYAGEFSLSSVIVQPEHAYGGPRSPPPHHAAGSPARRQHHATLASQQAYMRRPVGERMAEARSLELLARPMEAAIHGGVARDFIQSKFGLGGGQPFISSPPSLPAAPPSQSISVSGTRPIERYGRNWRESKLARGSRLQPNILPKAYRKNPKLFPPIAEKDTDQGILNLVQKGFIPSFVDVSAAFTSTPAPLQQAPSTFHHYQDQFKKQNLQIATHAFNLSQVKLDLGEVILDKNLLDDYDREQRVREEEKQQHALPASSQLAIATQGGQTLGGTNFAFPQLMPSDAEAADRERNEQALVLHGRQDIDDLLTTHLDAEEPSGPRDYDELLDTYSLHQFLIRKGKTLASTPEFQSFARKHHHAWGSVRQVLRELEKICKDFDIPIATVNGHRVVELAEDELMRLTPEVLFSCFILSGGGAATQDDPVLRALVHAPGKARYTLGGSVARLLAALKVQSTWRMFVQRRLYLNYRFRHTKAILIQRCWRRFQTLLRTREEIARRASDKLTAWRAIQDAWKKSWSSFGRKKRVMIHLPSISTEPYQRQATFNFAVRENAQLARLCDIADAHVDVLYLSPFHLNQDVSSYYLKLLEVGGCAGSVASRVKILVPENAPRFPEYFSLAKQVLYSPKCLKKIREYLRGRPCCLVPGEIGPEDLALAVELGVPLFSAEPEVAGLFGSKSGSKRIFAAAEVSVAPGAHDIYDEVDLYSYLAKLVVDHLAVARWFLKIDNESGGRGIACVDTQHFKVIAALREEKAQHANRWTLPEVLANAQERVVVALKKSLAKKVVLATPAIYDSRWSNFAAAFFRVGGVIEAAPPVVIGSPSVNMFIEPDGGVSLLNSHDQVFSSAFVFSGANFPSSAPADLIHPAALSIARACFREGVLGYVGVDFVAWNDGPGSAPKVWAVDLNLKVTATQASFMMFHFLLKGRYVHANSAAQYKDVPVHLRPPARYIVPGTSSLVAHTGAGSTARTASRSGLVSSTSASPSARMFNSSGSAAGSQAGSAASSRESSRPPSGQTTPKLPGIDRKSQKDAGGGAAASTSTMPVGKEELRFYSTVPYLYQPHLATVQFGSFFNLCRLKGVSFDVRARVGTVFMLMDSLASGSLGLLSVGQAAPPPASNPHAVIPSHHQAQLPASPLHAMTLLIEALAFLNEQVSSLRLGAHLYDSESNLTPMLAAYKGLAKAQREAQQLAYIEQQQQAHANAHDAAYGSQ